MRQQFMSVTAMVAVLFLPAGVKASPASSFAPSPSPWLQGWPMAAHDPQRTNRSPVAGPIQPHLVFKRKRTQVQLVGPDGTMYGCAVNRSRHGGESASVALDASGRIRWTYRFCIGFAGIAPDGTTAAVGVELPRGRSRFSDSDTTAAGFSPDGRLLWRIKPFGLLKGLVPLVSQNGLLYADPLHIDAYEGLSVIAMDTGKVVLHAPDAGVSALGPDGSMYVGGSSLVKFDPTGQPLWERTPPFDQHFGRLVLIGDQGAVYVGNGQNLFAYDPSGRLLWHVTKPDTVLGLAERPDGSLLLTGQRTLDALSPGGTRLWQQPLGESTQYSAPSVMVDAAGTAYVGTRDGRLRIFSAAGALLATLKVGPRGPALVPDAILAPDGRLVVNGTDGALYMYRP